MKRARELYLKLDNIKAKQTDFVLERRKKIPFFVNESQKTKGFDSKPSVLQFLVGTTVYLKLLLKKLLKNLKLDRILFK
jgi:hypothetical protein